MDDESLTTAPLQPVRYDEAGRILDPAGKLLDGIVLNMNGTYDRVEGGESIGTFPVNTGDTSFQGEYTLAATNTED